MKRGMITYFNEKTGNGRLKVMDKKVKFLDYLELQFDYRALNGKYTIKSGDEVQVELREFQGIPYVEKVVK